MVEEVLPTTAGPPLVQGWVLCEGGTWLVAVVGCGGLVSALPGCGEV